MTVWATGHSARLTSTPLIALNFHDIPADSRPLAEERIRQVAALGPGFDPDEREVDGPRVMVGFYDGYREAGAFGADLCSRLGLRAFFFPIFTRLDGERGTATDDDLADVATAHELCFHTASHLPADEIDERRLATEVTDPFDRLTALAGRPPRLAAWRGGTRYAEALVANRTLHRLGITHLVSNWSVERLPSGSASEACFEQN